MRRAAAGRRRLLFCQNLGGGPAPPPAPPLPPCLVVSDLIGKLSLSDFSPFCQEMRLKMLQDFFPQFSSVGAKTAHRLRH